MPGPPFRSPAWRSVVARAVRLSVSRGLSRFTSSFRLIEEVYRTAAALRSPVAYSRSPAFAQAAAADSRAAVDESRLRRFWASAAALRALAIAPAVSPRFR